MEQNIEKFLDFNGKKIYFKSFDGIYYIAIKPICEALNVNYDRQYRNLKSDEILGGVCAKQHIHDASFRLQEMICLPEYYVYGWLFSIQSESKDLKHYKWKCYEILYNYFHGAITERTSYLKEKTKTEYEIYKLEAELK